MWSIFRFKQKQADTTAPAVVEAREGKAFCDYINTHMGSTGKLQLTARNTLDIKQLLRSLCDEWPPADAPPRTYAYETFNRRIKDRLDIPLNEEARTLFPHLVGDKTNFNQLIPAPIRSYLGVVEYHWKEEQLNHKACATVMTHMLEEYDALLNMSPEQTTAHALSHIQKAFIPLQEIRDLRNYLFARTEIMDEMDDEKTTDTIEREYDGEASSISHALKTYTALIERAENAPNPQFIALINYIRTGLDSNLLEPNTALHFISAMSRDELFETPEPHGMEMETLQRILDGMKKADKGQNKGWSL